MIGSPGEKLWTECVAEFSNIEYAEDPNTTIEELGLEYLDPKDIDYSKTIIEEIK